MKYMCRHVLKKHDFFTRITQYNHQEQRIETLPWSSHSSSCTPTCGRCSPWAASLQCLGLALEDELGALLHEGRPGLGVVVAGLASTGVEAEPPVAKALAVPLDALGDLAVAAWPGLVVFVHGHGRIVGACLIEADMTALRMGGTDFRPGYLPTTRVREFHGRSPLA
jgi:hypothetical protein